MPPYGGLPLKPHPVGADSLHSILEEPELLRLLRVGSAPVLSK